MKFPSNEKHGCSHVGCWSQSEKKYKDSVIKEVRLSTHGVGIKLTVSL